MRSPLPSLACLSSALALATAAFGCGSSGSGGGPDATTDAPSTLGVNRTDAGALSSGIPEAGVYSSDAFFATDPPPTYCVLDGGAAPAPPTGTPECPSDKNRQGCPCSTPGQTAACWPGLRVDRNIGSCKDGTTTCTSNGEGLNQVWGECVGYVLPAPGATTGAAACKCFSSGQWNLSNLSPCFITYGSGDTYGVSSYLTDGGVVTCPTVSSTPPPTPQPGVPWSTDTLKVDCAGRFKLCFTIKAGSATSPQPGDCVLGTSCVQGDYPTANTLQPFPPLAGWASTDPACAAKFVASGGYGEMSVQGVSELCEGIGAQDGGAPEVFNRVPYCPTTCNANPSAPGCANCKTAGSGTFGN